MVYNQKNDSHFTLVMFMLQVYARNYVTTIDETISDQKYFDYPIINAMPDKIIKNNIWKFDKKSTM